MMYKKVLVFVFFTMTPALVMAAGDGKIHAIYGKVWVNGKSADKSTNIHFGDQVITAGLSRVTLSLDGSVYRIASSSKLTLPQGSENIALKFLYGAFSAVFRRRVQKTIYTNTAVLGVRGTGIHMSSRKQETYLCTCYGDIDFVDALDESNQAHIHAAHHNAIVFKHDSREIIGNQAMLDHVDEDLFALEALADRTPPETFLAGQEFLNRLSL